MGHVIQAGAGQITARQASVKGGIPMNVPAITINKVCIYGINANVRAEQLTRAGENDIVVARGMESTTKARSEERRVGKEGVSQGRSRWCRVHYKNNPENFNSYY